MYQNQLVRKIDHYNLTTKNLIETVKFYRKLGFKYDSQKKCLCANTFSIKLQTKKTKAYPLPKNVSVGSIDICFKSNLKPKEMVRYLRSKNIRIAEGPVPRRGFKGKVTSVYVYDPSGNLLEFCYYKKPFPIYPWPIYPFPILKNPFRKKDKSKKPIIKTTEEEE